VIVRRAGRIPHGLTCVDLPAQTYAVFEHDGHVSTIQNTYAAIWDNWLGVHGYDIADTASLEKHKPTFDTRTGLGGVEIWIAVKPRG
jgi:AraC family transcriptional regulator